MNTRSSIKRLCLCKGIMLLGSMVMLVACGESIELVDSQEPDPVVIDVPIAYIKRDLSLSEDSVVRPLTDPSVFIAGASLVIKARANTSAAEIDITSLAFENIVNENGEPLPYDVKDLDSDYSGTRLIFSMRAPQALDSDDEPTWNIWEYDRTNTELRRIITSDLSAQAGHDTGPTYLADGRILFSSTRQRGNQARLLDEGKPQYASLEEGRDVAASVLHIMNADGSNIQQISFNQSHDLDPVVLPNGKILFSRWDQAASDKGIHLYQMNADGSDLEIIYGRHSHDSIEGLDDIQYAATSVTPDNRILAAINSFEQTRLGTDFIAIDIQNYIDNQRPIDSMPSLSGPAQQSFLFDNIDIISDISPGGYVVNLYPLWDGSDRILFSWSQCRLLAPLGETQSADAVRTIAPCNEANIADSNYTLAPDLYGLWMFSPGNENEAATQLPLNQSSETSVVTEIVAMQVRPFPDNPSSTVDTSLNELIDQAYGVLDIQSVYDIDGQDLSPFGITNMANPLAVDVSQRPARFLRVVKSVSIPDEDTLDFSNNLFGASRGQLFREIVGYTPIQPDGSVKVAVPAGVPLAISIVDENARRITPRHNNWLQLVPGEQKTCVGCHATNSTEPHGRVNAQPPSVNLGAISTGVPFPNTNPALFADAGETMAQTQARVMGLARLSANVEYEDIWADTNIQTAAEAFQYRYQDLDTPLPITQSCAQTWSALCRSVINFPDHIAPLFTLSRQVLDADLVVLADNTCVSCHSPNDEDGNTRVPLAQLDLSNIPSSDNANFLTSYRELFASDNEQELIEGALVDRLVAVLDADGNPTFLVDEDGELVLDPLGNPIPITQTVRVNASMRANGAQASGRFLNQFENGASHQDMMSDAELRLISEWLDIGAQYYNNPFDAEQN